jgi:hypothetical protein
MVPHNNQLPRPPRPPNLGQVADAHYENPRLAALYDPLDRDRPDLEVYAAMARHGAAP